MIDILHSHKRSLELEARGEALILQAACPPPLVEELETDRGLHVFSRKAEREHQRLLDITRQPENQLSLAYTPEGVIVGQVTLAPLHAWGTGLPNAYEIALEVSSSWRRRGVARSLLNLSLQIENIEDLIILGFGLSWHWDITGLGLTPLAYRSMLVQLMAYNGFIECPTNDENICMDPYNVLLARVGSHVPAETTVQFYNDLFLAN